MDGIERIDHCMVDYDGIKYFGGMNFTGVYNDFDDVKMI